MITSGIGNYISNRLINKKRKLEEVLTPLVSIISENGYTLVNEASNIPIFVTGSIRASNAYPERFEIYRGINTFIVTSSRPEFNGYYSDYNISFGYTQNETTMMYTCICCVGSTLTRDNINPAQISIVVESNKGIKIMENNFMTEVLPPFSIINGREYNILVKKRKEVIELYINGELLYSKVLKLYTQNKDNPVPRSLMVGSNSTSSPNILAPLSYISNFKYELVTLE